MNEARAALAADHYRIQADGCRSGASASPFYATMLDALGADAARRGPAARVLDPVLDSGFLAALPLRLLGGIHREVLSGRAPALATRFPSTGGDGDARAAIDDVLRMCDDPPPGVHDALDRDPQTNEVGRAASLAVGLAAIGSITRRPIRLFEIGSSGGLNLRLDHYWYDADGGWGNPDAPVRFAADEFLGRTEFAAAVPIVERRGCDLHPLDATTDAGVLTLLGYVWPDQTERLDRLRRALAVARDVPVTIDAQLGEAFVDQHFRPEPGTTTVLMHSIVWQYIPEAERRTIRAIVAERVAHSSVHAPCAWLRFEPRSDWTLAETHIEIWPHRPGAVRVAASGFHGPPVHVFR